MEQRLKLNDGKTLIRTGHDTKGTIGQTEIWKYKIVNSNGNEVGTVIHTETTAIRGFKVTQSVIQLDNEGNTIVKNNW